MRVATYARYSSDQQRAASITDQQRLCREFAARRGWTVAAEYEDAAISGSSLMRPGMQALLQAVRDGQFDIVLAESLDRFSRDLEDTAGLFKRLAFKGVRIVTVAEGDISHLHIGVKGLMGELYLKDLADKTRRGLRGRVEAGRSGGGLSYGYRVTRVLEGQERGARDFHPEEAAVVQRIFRAYVSGVSPKAIAQTLNRDGVPGPRGVAWSPSTIHGHAGRGTGILNNEMYIGRLIWNRQRFVKDPDTGKRQARPNPSAEWITKDVPDLRVISDEIWQAAKARQAQSRVATQGGLVHARRPKYLFSGLTCCETCGGSFTLSSRDTLVCFNADARGTCANRRRIKRQDVEARVLRAMRERFFERGAFAAFCKGFTAELEAQRRERLTLQAGARRELAHVEREIWKLIQAIKNGVSGLVVRDAINALEARRAALAATVAEPVVPALHPNMAEVFRHKTTTLSAGLEHDDQRDAARQALRGFIDKIVIPPGDGLLQVVGNLGKMLEAAGGRNQKNRGVGYVGCGGRI